MMERKIEGGGVEGEGMGVRWKEGGGERGKGKSDGEGENIGRERGGGDLTLTSF